MSDWIQDNFGVKYTLEGVRGLIHSLGFRKLFPRPVHPKAQESLHHLPTQTQDRCLTICGSRISPREPDVGTP